MEVLLLLVAIPVGGTLVTRWQLHRRNRVHPRVPSPAPLRWLWSPAAPARLHRRLQTTVRVAAVHTPRRELGDVAERAVELDRRVVLASRQSLGSRTSTIRALVAEADELDRLALAVDRPFAALVDVDPVDRLAALAEARSEVDALDRHRR